MNSLSNKFFSYVMALLALVFVASCDNNEEGGPTPPPVISLGNNTALFVETGSPTTFTVDLTAAGRIKALSASATFGAVIVDELTGIGMNTGSATLTYTPPTGAGNGSITLVLTDESDANASASIEVTVSLAEDLPIEVSGVQTGTWLANKTYVLTGSVEVPQGQSLTIPAGVTVIANGDGSGSSPEFKVRGNIYVLGESGNRVKFTVPEASRTEANIFTGLWGGINCLPSTTEAVFLYTDIEYAGAIAGENSILVEVGELDDDDNRYAINFMNPAGKFVMMHSRIAYTPDDAIVFNGGEIIVANNFFEYTGSTGGEAINANGSTVGDIAFNIFFSPATNGLKWDNKNAAPGNPQTDINIYNNTILMGGFRQVKSGRGGSLNAQRDGRGRVHNNLLVNCRFGVRLREDQLPDLANIQVGHNFHYGNHESITNQFYPTSGVIRRMQEAHCPDAECAFQTGFDVAGGPGENNPLFVNFDVTTFNHSTASGQSVGFIPAGADFRLQGNSPALNTGITNFTPRIATLSAAGQVFNAPLPRAHAGAHGTDN